MTDAVIIDGVRTPGEKAKPGEKALGRASLDVADIGAFEVSRICRDAAHKIEVLTTIKVGVHLAGKR